MSDAPVIRPGMFGKLPSRRDFVRSGLPGSFVEPWDAWLQGALLASRDALGEQWLAIFLTSPIWRFALPPGVCGEAAMAGVLLPSVDGAGRYFPLTLAAALPGRPRLLALVAAGSSWYEGLEALGHAVLEQDLEPEVVNGRLAELAPPAPTSDEGRGSGWRSGWSAGAEGPPPAALLAALLDDLVHGAALWWTTGSERVPPTFAVSHGLPRSTAYRAMLDGSWSTGSWRDLGGDAAAAAEMAEEKPEATAEEPPSGSAPDTPPSLEPDTPPSLGPDRPPSLEPDTAPSLEPDRPPTLEPDV